MTTQQSLAKRSYEISVERVERPPMDGRAFNKIKGKYYQLETCGDKPVFDISREDILLSSLSRMIEDNPEIESLKIKLTRVTK